MINVLKSVKQHEKVQEQLGTNVKWETVNPAMAQEWMDILDVSTTKFVDEMTVRIKPGSRQSFFEERRYGIPFFTQFMSFTSHFSANILPRLYNTYMKEATAPVALSTFQILAGAIMVAYMSQYLKDLLLKGQLHPSLADFGDVQRAIDYSGATGWVSEIINRTVRGPYGYGGTIEDMLSSPTLSHLGGVLGDIGEGEFGKAAERGLPFGNVATGIYNNVQNLLEEE